MMNIDFGKGFDVLFVLAIVGIIAILAGLGYGLYILVKHLAWIG